MVHVVAIPQASHTAEVYKSYQLTHRDDNGEILFAAKLEFNFPNDFGRRVYAKAWTTLLIPPPLLAPTP